MPNVVKRGANRPAHNARTNKAAQRTPLPPRPQAVEDAREAIREAKAIVPPDAKSPAKARAFIEEAATLGWMPRGKGYIAAEDLATLSVTRGEEVITIEWRHGVFQHCTYSCPGRTGIKLNNASAARKRMAVPTDKALEEAQTVTARKVIRQPRREPAVRVRHRLPFSEASLDQDVLDALYGKAITWTNSISGQAEEDRVPKAQKTVVSREGAPIDTHSRNAPRIVDSPRGRCITFVGLTGYRTVLVSAIVRVR